MDKKTRRHLKTLDSFADRLAERRRLGNEFDEIAAYAHQMVVNRRTNPHLQLDFDEASLSTLLTVDEYAAYKRLEAAAWARAKRKQLIALKEAKITSRNEPQLTAIRERETERHQQEAEIRRRLLKSGAVSISEVARRLGVSIAFVRKLHQTGQLPSAGFVPIQYSHGKPVHLWLPETIIRYLNRGVSG